MHELSIVMSVLDQLGELRKQHAGAHVTKVALRVGELAGVDVDCLRFGFECVVKETEWEPLELEIESVARRQRCPRCQHEFTADGWAAFDRLTLPFTACPRCGEVGTLTIAGEELQIAYVEVEDPSEEICEAQDDSDCG
jgi:hydrogenase nickel incorporation protein HypA/HybF